jgi:uncharacterized delta-60 repeat protein
MKKTFTKQLAYAIVSCLAVPLTVSAQDFSGMEGQKGYELSKKYGVVAKLQQLQKKSVHRSETDGGLQNWAKGKLGIKSESIFQPRNGQTNEYDFYGGVSERGNNVPFASVTDAMGNIYMTGGSSNLDQQSGDFFTIKISPAGAVLWEKREQAMIFAVDTGMEITLAPDGNIIVSGTHWNGTETDIKTIKYNAADGTQIWQNIYNGEGEGVDVPTAMVTDATGNTIVTGLTWSGDSIDYLTIKYGADGTQLWDATSNPVGSDAWNEPRAVTLDADGNVIVSGYSPNPEGWLNYYTIKYNADGAEQWNQSYHFQNLSDEEDPESPLIPTNSVPAAVIADSNGNIYVTGTFDTFSDRIGTIKYTALGEEEWVEIYKSGTELTTPFNIAIEDDALYIGGCHYGGFESDGLVLASYDFDGNLNWVEESNDFIEVNYVKLTFDGDGNPVIAGFGKHEGEEAPVHYDTSVKARKYNDAGDLLEESGYIIPYSPTAGLQSLVGISITPDDNVYFALTSFYSEVGSAYEAIKTTFDGADSEPLWDVINTNTGGFNATMFYSVPDSQGNTYVTGAYYIFNAAQVSLDTNYTLVKYNATGGVEWEKVFSPQNGNLAYGIIVRTDDEDNVILALLPHVEQDNGVLKLKKFSPDGNELWTIQKSLENARIMAMEIGNDESVYIGGTAKDNPEEFSGKIAALKFSASGSEEWTVYTGNGDESANFYDISSGKVTAAGDFILTGTSGVDSMMFDDLDLTVAKITADGEVDWVTLAPVDGFFGAGNDVLLHNDGSIYVAGLGVRGSGNFDDDRLTAKLSADGAVLWTKIVGEEDRHERALSIKQLSTGEVVVAGYSQYMFGASIYNVLTKYDAEGNDLWTYNSEEMRFFNDFHVDGSDVSYILNQAQISTIPYRLQNDLFPIASLVKVDVSGVGEEEFFIGPAYAEAYITTLVPHIDNRLLLAGSVANQGFYEGLYFFETTHDGTLGTGEHTIPQNNANWLGQNYPNPVSGGTAIPFYLVDGGNVNIKLYNSQGRFVKEVVEQVFAPGQHTVQIDASGLAKGIYFYQIRSGKFKQARKMIVN